MGLEEIFINLFVAQKTTRTPAREIVNNGTCVLSARIV